MLTSSSLLCLIAVSFLPNYISSERIHASEVDQWVITQPNQLTLKYLWTIGNFSLFKQEVGEYIESPAFQFNEDAYKNWTLRLYPRSVHGDDRLAISLRYDSNGTNDVKGDLKLALLDANSDVIEYYNGTSRFTNESAASGAFFSFTRDEVLNETYGVLKNDAITVYAELNVTAGQNDIIGSCVSSNDSQRADHLAEFFNNKELSDFTFIVKNRKIATHKVILAAHSRKIRRKLRANPNLQQIKDHLYDYELIMELIRFMYTGTVMNLEKWAKQLLPVSNTYEIDALKQLTEEAICQSISRKNVIDIVRFAYSLDAQHLKTSAAKFIAAHASDLIYKKEFYALERDLPLLAKEIYKLMVDGKRN